MDYIELDKTLKLLNGFNNNLFKRNAIINDIKANGRISVFAYGSLLWNPIEHFNEFISNCFLFNYMKGFFCEDFIYRGTKSFTGLTMALEKCPNGIVHGCLLVSTGDEIIPFLKSFVQRETPIDSNGIVMDIYKYDYLPILLPDKINCEYAITCIVNEKSLFYLNKQLTIEAQAKKIVQAYGRNGSNFQYLENLKKIYSKFDINDSFSRHFDHLYRQILSYYLTVTIYSRKSFRIYHQLQILQELLKKRNSLLFLPDFSPQISSKEINQHS